MVAVVRLGVVTRDLGVVRPVVPAEQPPRTDPRGFHQETRHRPSSVLMPSGYGFGRLSSTLESWPGDSGWPSLFVSDRLCIRPPRTLTVAAALYRRIMANNAGTPTVRPIPTDSHSGFRPLRIGALSLAGRRNTQGEEKIAAITESSVRFPCPPRTVVGVLLIAAIPRSPPLIRTAVYEGSAAVSRDLAGVQALWPRD